MSTDQEFGSKMREMVYLPTYFIFATIQRKNINKFTSSVSKFKLPRYFLEEVKKSVKNDSHDLQCKITAVI